ncbi:MAG: flagellar basal body-associated FliL family protein [Pseudomonadota bacterium]
MTDAAAPDAPDVPKSSKLPLMIGVVLALLGGAGGFFAVQQGLVFAPESTPEVKDTEKDDAPSSIGKIVFVPIEPIKVSLPSSSRYRHLLFRAELEVEPAYKADVETLLPRIVDVLNGYLRAVNVSDIEASASLTRLRSQMLRRVQIVTGPGRINDLLIMEFVLN